MIIKYTIFATVVALCTGKAQQDEDHRLLRGLLSPHIEGYTFRGNGCCINDQGYKYNYETVKGDSVEECAETCKSVYLSEKDFVGINFHSNWLGKPNCNCMMSKDPPHNGKITSADGLCHEVCYSWNSADPNSGGDSNPNPSQGQPLDVVFAIDISISMCKKDLAGLSWLDKTKDAVNEFLDTIDTDASSSSMAGYVGWEYLSFRFKIKVLTEDIHDVKDGVSGLYCHNEILKSYAAGMNTALRVFDSSTRPDSDPSSKAIIFITDNTPGDTFTPCGGGDVSRGVVFYTVGYETSEEQGDWLAQQAACNGGFFRRSDGTSITTAKIFREIFDTINN